MYMFPMSLEERRLHLLHLQVETIVCVRACLTALRQIVEDGEAVEDRLLWGTKVEEAPLVVGGEASVSSSSTSSSSSSSSPSSLAAAGRPISFIDYDKGEEIVGAVAVSMF